MEGNASHHYHKCSQNRLIHRLELSTFRIHVKYPKLFLNAATWGRGSIRVEALTRDWQPIQGFTESQARDIRGDALDHPVRWEDDADLSRLLGQEIRLKLYMTRARIHAMTMSDEDRKLGAIDSEDGNDKTGDSSPELI